MNRERDYIQDIAEMRSMMERSSKFLSLSGWAGIMAGIYALVGAWIAYYFYAFNPDEIVYRAANYDLAKLVLLALVVLILALGTAMVLSSRKAQKRGETVWNATSRRLLINMAIPLSAGAILMALLLAKDLAGLMPPLSLLFYGLAIYNASKFTFDDLKFLGLIQMGLGLISVWFIAYGLLLWALGFGVVHIGYGIYMHCKYER